MELIRLSLQVLRHVFKKKIFVKDKYEYIIELVHTQGPSTNDVTSILVIFDPPSPLSPEVTFQWTPSLKSQKCTKNGGVCTK